MPRFSETRKLVNEPNALLRWRCPPPEKIHAALDKLSETHGESRVRALYARLHKNNACSLSYRLLRNTCIISGHLCVQNGASELHRGGVVRHEVLGWFQCVSCYENFLDQHYDSDGECIACAEDRRDLETQDRESENDLLEYGANPLRILPSKNCFAFAEGEKQTPKNTTLFLGVELECVAKNGVNAAIKGLGGFGEHAIFTKDGSLPNDGLEIVTAPMTLARHKEIWTKHFFSKKPAQFLSAWAHDACGMHVHLSRDAISPLTLGKLLVFINDPQNTSFVDTIAGRGANTYCQKKVKTFGHARREDSDRYQALNLATRKATIELRIFRANVMQAGFFKNLEFAHALVRFCENTSANTLSVEGFCKFVSRADRAPDYENLNAFLRSYACIPPKKINPKAPQVEQAICA